MTKKEILLLFSRQKKTKLSESLPNICCLSFLAHKRKEASSVIVALPSPLSVPRSLLEPVLFYWRRQPSLPWLSLSLLSLSLSLFLSVSGLLVDRERKKRKKVPSLCGYIIFQALSRFICLWLSFSLLCSSIGISFMSYFLALSPHKCFSHWLAIIQFLCFSLFSRV